MTRILSAIVFIIVLVALATGRLARWCWSHRQQALDTTARAILATHAAGRRARAWVDEHQDQIVSTTVLTVLVVLSACQRAYGWGQALRRSLAQHQDLACQLLEQQPWAPLAPITANLAAARRMAAAA